MDEMRPFPWFWKTINAILKARGQPELMHDEVELWWNTP